MALMSNVVYRFYLYFLIPIFLLILFGKPRFLIKLIHKIMNIKEPFKQIKIFVFYTFACLIYTILCFFNKYQIEKFITNIDHSSKNMETYNSKIRELNLNERNGFMFLNFFIIMILIERLCDSHFKIWAEEDKKIQIENKMKNETKDKKEQ